MRTGMIEMPLSTTRSISRRICGDEFARDEKIRTITRHWSSASMMEAPQSEPGRMSRGAIQQRMPDDSSAAHAASATALSSLA